MGRITIYGHKNLNVGAGEMPSSNKGKNELYQLHVISMDAVMIYQDHEIGESFIIPLKVPAEDEKFLDDHKHYTKSNINVCYASPRSKKKARDWYETQLNVNVKVRCKKGYPIKGVPFYVVTDDGYGFMAHTTSAGNKQFAAVGDELILGKWIKGRLIEEGLVNLISDTAKDIKREGMITKEMLDQYGCNAIALQKTDLKIPDPQIPKNYYDVWTLKLIQIEEDNG